MEVIDPNLNKPRKVIGVLARTLRARAVRYDVGPPAKDIIFTPFNTDVTVKVVAAAAEAVAVGDELITIDTDDGVSTVASIAALVAGNPAAAARLAVSGDAGALPVGFAVAGVKLYDGQVIPPGAMFYMDKGGAWVPYKGFDGDVTVDVAVDAFKIPPDSVLGVGTDDGTITGVKLVQIITTDGTRIQQSDATKLKMTEASAAGILDQLDSKTSTLATKTAVDAIQTAVEIIDDAYVAPDAAIVKAAVVAGVGQTTPAAAGTDSRAVLQALNRQGFGFDGMALALAGSSRILGIGGAGAYVTPHPNTTTVNFTGINLLGAVKWLYNLTTGTVHHISNVVNPVPPTAGSFTVTPPLGAVTDAILVPILSSPPAYSTPTDATRTEPVTASPPRVNGPAVLVNIAQAGPEAAATYPADFFIANYGRFGLEIAWANVNAANTYTVNIYGRINDDAAWPAVAPGGPFDISGWMQATAGSSGWNVALQAGTIVCRIADPHPFREIRLTRTAAGVHASAVQFRAIDMLYGGNR